MLCALFFFPHPKKVRLKSFISKWDKTRFSKFVFHMRNLRPREEADLPKVIQNIGSRGGTTSLVPLFPNQTSLHVTWMGNQ